MNKIEKFRQFAQNRPGFDIKIESDKLIYSGLFEDDRYSIPAWFEIANSGDNYLFFLLSPRQVDEEIKSEIYNLCNSVNRSLNGCKCFLGPTNGLLNGIACYVSEEHAYQPEWFFNAGRLLAFSCIDTFINLRIGNGEPISYKILNSGPSKAKILEDYIESNRNQWVFDGQWRKTATADAEMQLMIFGRIAEVHTTMGEFQLTYTIFVDDSVFSRLLYSLFQLPADVDLSKVLRHLNTLNAKYRNQKFFVARNTIFMNIAYLSPSEYFDPELLHDAFQSLLFQDFYEIIESILASITTIPSAGITHQITLLKSDKGDLLDTVIKNRS
jgi:hypothetical protein